MQCTNIRVTCNVIVLKKYTDTLMPFSINITTFPIQFIRQLISENIHSCHFAYNDANPALSKNDISNERGFNRSPHLFLHYRVYVVDNVCIW